MTGFKNNLCQFHYFGKINFKEQKTEAWRKMADMSAYISFGPLFLQEFNSRSSDGRSSKTKKPRTEIIQWGLPAFDETSFTFNYYLKRF